ncbi:MAG: asparagine synthase [Candidatus Kuenenia sp.]|nr:asparagine synthase [Candidatus Kuenenia hertensis]
MAGLFGIISDRVGMENLKIEVLGLGRLIFDEKRYSNAFIQKYTCPKFLKDKVFSEKEGIFIAIDGYILNFKILKNKYVANDYFETIKKMYECCGDEFFNEFRGEFSGVLYDKIKNKWLVFTSHTGSKPVFYYKSDELIIFSSEVKVICQILRKHNSDYSLDELGAYFLLTYGFMIEDFTLINEAKKLKPGNYLKIEDGKFLCAQYHRFGTVDYRHDSKKKIIDTLDELFINAVKSEYEKDLEYGYKHIATLSGGLDTRMNVMTANKLGYRDILNITFAQSNYYDERISKKIATDLGYEYLFCSLDTGNYLKDIESPVLCNDGLVLYSGSAHLLASIRKINFERYGLVHTGMLGDAILGSYLTKPAPVKPVAQMGTYSEYLMKAVVPKIETEVDRYLTEDVFKLYNRGFNGILNGNWTIGQFTECVSPFLDVDFIEYCLSIPPSLRYKQRIYLEWMITKHPTYTKYIWESTKLRPSTNRILPFILKVLHRSYIKVTGRTDLLSMYPFQYWYDTNSNLRSFVENYFKENIALLDDHGDLKKDCESLFNSGTMIEKTQVMTLLEAVKLYFH